MTSLIWTNSYTVTTTVIFMLLSCSWLFAPILLVQGQQTGMQNLEVVTIENPPFIHRKEGTDEHGEMAEGYLIDVWEAIAKRMQFDYRIHFVRDGQFGRQLSDGRWTGLIGELINRQAIVALAPLTITSTREKAVDFTYPFMSTGITAMMKKPTMTSKSVKFTDFPELAATENVTYGTLQAGSTHQFFADSKHKLYKAMGQIMNKNQQDLPTTIEEAVEKVKTSPNFVFLGESAMLDFQTGLQCELMKLEKNINSVGYGIGFPRGHHLTSHISLTLLELQDKGILQKLKEKWWVRRCSRQQLCACQEGISSEEITKEEYEDDDEAAAAGHTARVNPWSALPTIIAGQILSILPAASILKL